MSHGQDEVPGLTFKGRGPNFTPLFSLEPGLATFHASHEGRGSFCARLLAESGSEIARLFETHGAFVGGRAIGVDEPGRYIFDVVADGSWSLTINPENPQGIEVEGQLFNEQRESVVESWEPQSEVGSASDSGVLVRRPVTLTAEEFLESAETVALAHIPLVAQPSHFSTGSFGWRAEGRIVVTSHGLQMPVMAGITLVVTGSKRGLSLITEAEFDAVAQAISLSTLTAQAQPVRFSTGSFGWRADGPTEVRLTNGRAVPVSLSANLTVSGSKPKR